MADKRFLTVPDVATELDVSEETVRRWLRAGRLRGLLLGDKAGYRIARVDLEQFIQEQYEEGGAAAGKVPAAAGSR